MTQNNQVAVIDRAKQMLPEKGQFNAANSFTMNYGQETGFAVMAIQNNPYLLNCTPDSMRSAIINVALTGISLNPALKYAYLVPRKVKNELRAVLDISYMGMIKILTDAGAVKSISADVICEHDDFVYSQGSSPILKHKPDLLKDRGKPIGAYAIAYFRDGGFQFEVMAKPEIEKIRATSESWKNNDTRQFSPWEKWADEMWKKTVMKRLFKVLPKTHFDAKLIAALSKEHENELADAADTTGRIDSIFEDVVEPEVIQDEPRKKNPVTSKSIKDETKEVPEKLFNEVQGELKEDQDKS